MRQCTISTTIHLLFTDNTTACGYQSEVAFDAPSSLGDITCKLCKISLEYAVCVKFQRENRLEELYGS